MSATVQADFNCPYSHLAGEQADLLTRSGVAVDLRGVEHAPRLDLVQRPGTDGPAASRRTRWPSRGN